MAVTSRSSIARAADRSPERQISRISVGKGGGRLNG